MNGTINELKQGLLKCANENEDRTYLTGQVIISSICKDAKDTVEELEKENEQLRQENKSLAKRICELQSDLAKAKSQIEIMKCCFNCEKPMKYFGCGDCHNGSNWELAPLARLIRLEE